MGADRGGEEGYGVKMISIRKAGRHEGVLHISITVKLPSPFTCSDNAMLPRSPTPLDFIFKPMH